MNAAHTLDMRALVQPHYRWAASTFASTHIAMGSLGCAVTGRHRALEVLTQRLHRLAFEGDADLIGQAQHLAPQDAPVDVEHFL